MPKSEASLCKSWNLTIKEEEHKGVEDCWIKSRECPLRANSCNRSESWHDMFTNINYRIKLTKKTEPNFFSAKTFSAKTFSAKTFSAKLFPPKLFRPKLLPPNTAKIVTAKIVTAKIVTAKIVTAKIVHAKL